MQHADGESGNGRDLLAARRGFLLLLVFAALVSLTNSCGPGTADRPSTDPTLTRQASGTEERLQAISPVNDRVAWVSGLGGTYAVTVDGGQTWRTGVVPGAESLQFRDVHAVDSSTAYLLSAGTGSESRIYKTSDGGRNWVLQFVNHEPEAFFDCMAFWEESNGIAFSDAVGDRFLIIVTTNGEDWGQIPQEAIPAALPGEGGFAASGDCLVTFGDSMAWFGTGSSDRARVFVTADRGHKWAAHDTPIVSGPGRGITALAFEDASHGLAVGGDINSPHTYADNIARTADGGSTWTLEGRPTYPGAIYGVASIPRSPGSFVAVGPKGAAYTLDNGLNWTHLDTLAYWSIAFSPHHVGWAVGPEGRIALVRIF